MTPLSYQLYSSRNHGDLDATLEMLAGIGYTDVEGYGALFADLTDPGHLVDRVAAHGLRIKTAHIGLDMLEDDTDRALAVITALDLDAVFVPFLAPDARPVDADGWRAFGARLDRIGAPLRDAGRHFGWHNHDFEFAGDTALDHILAGGPRLALEFDVAWCVRAGVDPMDVIARHGDRIIAAHVKDIAPDGTRTDEDGWADVGHGTMDWSMLTSALRDAGCRHFVLEHDNPSDDRRFAERSFAFISQL